MESLVTGDGQQGLGNSKHDISRCWCNVAEGRKRHILFVSFFVTLVAIDVDFSGNADAFF